MRLLYFHYIKGKIEPLNILKCCQGAKCTFTWKNPSIAIWLYEEDFQIYNFFQTSPLIAYDKRFFFPHQKSSLHCKWSKKYLKKTNSFFFKHITKLFFYLNKLLSLFPNIKSSLTVKFGYKYKILIHFISYIYHFFSKLIYLTYRLIYNIILYMVF